MTKITFIDLCHFLKIFLIKMTGGVYELEHISPLYQFRFPIVIALRSYNSRPFDLNNG
jgi:hypothetical protein